LRPGTGKAADLQTEFTIKGVTEPVSLPVTVAQLEDGSVRISGKGTLDRSQFNLGWNKLGVMSDTVTVSADVVFVRSAANA
jgi:polyisoprenoid-binding protein YceI